MGSFRVRSGKASGLGTEVFPSVRRPYLAEMPAVAEPFAVDAGS